MPKDIHQRDTAQQRSSRLLLAMGIIVLLGALAYFVLTLVVNRRTPASPDTRYTAENGISVYYESAVWPVCEMTEDATLGRLLRVKAERAERVQHPCRGLVRKACRAVDRKQLCRLLHGIFCVFLFHCPVSFLNQRNFTIWISSRYVPSFSRNARSVRPCS